MKQLVQPSAPMYAVFGRGYDGDLYFIHMEVSTSRDTPGIWHVGRGDFKGDAVHENHDFYLHADQWHVMQPLLTPKWCREKHIRPDSILTREVQVRFIVGSPKPRIPNGWKLKILECNRSYKNRSITVVVNTSDDQKAKSKMLSPKTLLGRGSWTWHTVSVNHAAQTCKITFGLSDGEDITLHVKQLLELYRG